MQDCDKTMMAEAEQRRDAINRLVGWCKAQDPGGFHISGEYIQAIVDENSQVKIVARQDIPAKTPLIVVPPTLAFSTASVTHSRDLVPDYQAVDAGVRAYGDKRKASTVVGGQQIGTGGILTKDVDSLVQEYCLSLALTFELEAGPERLWGPYLDTLPEAPRCPVFDFTPQDLLACRGTYLHDMVVEGREEFESIMADVVRPILRRYQDNDPRFRYRDLEKTYRRAWALQASRGFEPIDGGSVLLPVVDCLNGQVEGASNVNMFNTSQVTSGRDIRKGEELLLDYGPKHNGLFLYVYGHLEDSMVFGNPFHKICMTFHHLFPLGPEFGTDVLRQAKIDFLNSHCRLAYWQSSFWSNLWLPAADADIEEERKKGLRQRGEMNNLRSAPFQIFTMFLALRDIQDLRKIEASGQLTLDGSNCDLELAAKIQLGIVDKLLHRLPRTTTIAEDLTRLQDPTLPYSTKLALRVAISDRQLLLQLRQEICRDFGLDNSLESAIWTKICEGCGTFKEVKRCAHCGVSYFCGKKCQRMTWKYHKLYRPAKEETTKPPAAAAASADSSGGIVKAG